MKKKLKFVILSALLIILIGIIGFTKQSYSNNNLEICHAGVFEPTIREVGQQFVVLNVDGGIMLAPNNKHEIRRDTLTIILELIDIDQENITFIYKSVTKSFSAEMPTAKNVEYECKLIIPHKNAHFYMPDKHIVEPADFKTDWVVEQYAQFRKTPPTYYLPAQTSFYTFIDAQYLEISSKSTISYDILLYVVTYETEGIASDAFIKGETLFHNLHGAHQTFNLDAEFSKYAEFCYTTVRNSCTYIGQFNKHLLEIHMINTSYKPATQPLVSVEDWQYIVNLAESKIKNEAR